MVAVSDGRANYYIRCNICRRQTINSTRKFIGIIDTRADSRIQFIPWDTIAEGTIDHFCNNEHINS